MSYLVLSLILSFLYGILGMFLFVLCNAPADNPIRVVFGSAAFWICLVALAYFSTGWSSALTAIASGFLLLLVSGNLEVVMFTWGRALIQLGNSMAMKLLLLGWPLRFIGGLLKKFEDPFRRRR